MIFKYADGDGRKQPLQSAALGKQKQKFSAQQHFKEVDILEKRIWDGWNVIVGRNQIRSVCSDNESF